MNNIIYTRNISYNKIIKFMRDVGKYDSFSAKEEEVTQLNYENMREGR